MVAGNIIGVSQIQQGIQRNIVKCIDMKLALPYLDLTYFLHEKLKTFIINSLGKAVYIPEILEILGDGVQPLPFAPCWPTHQSTPHQLL